MNLCFTLLVANQAYQAGIFIAGNFKEIA